jgi:F-type H+-transporting ATPase subunit a
VIKLPGESFSSSIPVLTNTLMGTFIADVLALGFVFLAARSLKEVPGRLQSVLELVVEFFDNLAKQMAGPIARKLLPLALTVFIFLLFANWLELVPGVDSVGTVKCSEVGANGYNAYKGIFGLEVLDVARPLDSGKLTTEDDLAACEKVAGGATLSDAEKQRADITAALDAKSGEDPAKVLTPAQLAVYQAKGFTPLRPNLHVVTSFVRAAATDLNLTLMLAVLAFLVIQFYGIQANGGAYFYKFINVPAIRQVAKAETPGKKAFAGIDIFVGLLEGVSELAKILSFGFRLFGNIFAGQALLFVMTFLVATLLPVIFYGLELFVGLIQAYVFAMLILMFTGMAIAGHHSEEAHGEHDLVTEGGGVSPL